jgi:hypothetical protein
VGFSYPIDMPQKRMSPSEGDRASATVSRTRDQVISGQLCLDHRHVNLADLQRVARRNQFVGPDLTGCEVTLGSCLSLTALPFVDLDCRNSHCAGTSAGAPLSLIKTTRNFAGWVPLAFRSTT